jgi:uncharacterized integral membrane protein
MVGQMMPLLIMGLVAELVTLFVLWSEGLLIAFCGAIVAGILAMVGTGIVLSLRRKKPTSVNNISD